MMREHPNYWRSSTGKLEQPPPSDQQAYNPTSLATPPLPLPVPPISSILNPPYLFGSSLFANPNALADHHHHENQDFPLSWSQLLMNGLANDQEQHNLGAGHVGDVKHVSLENQQSRKLYYSNKNNSHKEDLQACSSSWSSTLNPVPFVNSSSIMNLNNNTMFDLSSTIVKRNQYSSQYDDTSTSGASKKHRFQSSSSSQPSSMCYGTFTSGTSKRARVHHLSTETPLKMKKEKSGRDRISDLHQLVSPFGKTDTASVLYEATVHIKFFEAQIEALSSAYMNLANNVSGGTGHQHSADEKTPSRDLASRGLCLVPVTCMDHIDTTNMTSNGVEYWTPEVGGGLLELGIL